MISRRGLENTFVPFFDFDAYIRSLVIGLHHHTLSQRGIDRLQGQFSTAEKVRTIMTDARIGQIAKQRASELRPDELVGFVQAATDLVASENDWLEGLKQLGFSWNVKVSELEMPAETSSSAAVVLIAIAVLGRMETVNYSALSDTMSVAVEPGLAQQSSDWRKNRTPEHIWRQLAWAETMTETLWSQPIQALTEQSRDTLRAGHLFSAISLMARPLVR